MLGTTDPAGPPDGSWQEFGALLRHWRRHAGWTQAQLGAAVGYDHTAVSRLEHGARRATPRLVRRLDELLSAGGELSRSYGRAESAEGHRPALPAHLLRPPLPPGPHPVAPCAAPAHGAPGRLPDHDLQCPLHGAAGCQLPPPDAASALHAAFCADPAAALDTDTVHALAAVLAAQLRAAQLPGPQRAMGEPGPGAVIEGTLRAVVARLAGAPARQRRVLARLAAEYGHASGSLRLHGGRPATAMACFDRALGWAVLAGDPATQVAALSDMAVLGLLDDDPACSGDYAREIGRAAPGRPWAEALSRLGEARASALAGEVRATVRHIGRAHRHLDGPDSTDPRVPWLAPGALRLRVESGSAAALRDLAAATADPRLARRALIAARSALDLLGAGQLPAARAMLGVRVADCHLCADEPQAALAALAPLLDAEDAPPLPALVRHELRGVRDRLAAGAARWGAPSAEAAARLGAAI
ncbi:helix-turn-helix transcriptional regulator [Streptomyces sp. TLI_171]|uniref:helix-turn-helix domain-containing protein n=1 Tax=Streptomyces sp. TLI_171 TaxID=1938859 RepID=UPI000C18E9D7|nr:helix-turn-helix transcriptional regulator [Streptomyces sp. TLI_171]RKE23316.1 helix-turn-helix protein [Streptomyces sp. TLI_171]